MSNLFHQQVEHNCKNFMRAAYEKCNKPITKFFFNNEQHNDSTEVCHKEKFYNTYYTRIAYLKYMRFT